jgi:uncharacterized protein
MKRRAKEITTEDFIAEWEKVVQQRKADYAKDKADVDGDADYAIMETLTGHPSEARMLRKAARNAFEKVDCTKCARCCHLGVRPDDKEIKRIVDHLGIDDSTFASTYLEADGHLKRSPACIFLKDNKCSIYSARPDVCREYPHYESGATTIVKREDQCPVAYDIVQQMWGELENHKTNKKWVGAIHRVIDCAPEDPDLYYLLDRARYGKEIADELREEGA